MSNYATKAYLKNVTGVDTSDFAKKTHSENFKSDVDKLDIDKLKNLQSNFSNLKSKVDKLNMQKLETTRFDLSKLSNVVKNEVVKKNEYHELVKKVNAIRTTDTNNLVQKLTITQTLMELKKCCW